MTETVASRKSRKIVKSFSTKMKLVIEVTLEGLILTKLNKNGIAGNINGTFFLEFKSHLTGKITRYVSKSVSNLFPPKKALWP